MLLFLSYSRDDRDLIEVLRFDLSDSGHDVWLDEKLSGGQQWWTSILEQIRRADVFVLAVTELSLESEACIAEVEYAHAVGKVVIPVALADGLHENLAPMPLPRYQWISYVKGDKAELKRLLRAAREAPQSPLPDPLPPDPKLPLSYVAELRQLVDSTSELDRAEQVLLLDRFESHITDTKNRDKLASLLAEFRQRGDLRANLLPTIDRLLEKLGQSPGPTGAPSPSGHYDVSSSRYDDALEAQGIAELLEPKKPTPVNELVVSLPSILFHGSVNSWRRTDDESRHARVLARCLGEELIARELSLVLTSGEGLDMDLGEAARAACQRLGVDERAVVRTYPYPSESRSGYGQILESPQGDDDDLRTYLVNKVDAVIAISGGEGTKDALDKALSLRKPVFPVATVPGAAQDCWRRLRDVGYWNKIGRETEFLHDASLGEAEMAAQIAAEVGDLLTKLAAAAEDDQGLVGEADAPAAPADQAGLDLFISHSSTDVDLVAALVDLLQDALGLPPERIRASSVDGYGLPAGMPFEEALRRETQDAQVFIGLITHSSLRSTYVTFALGARWASEEPLVPLLGPGVAAADLRGPLATLNAVHLDERADVLQLVSDLAEELEITIRPAHRYARQLEQLLSFADADGTSSQGA